VGLGERIQTADWKKEKHVPVIECPDQVKAGEVFEVKVGLGKEIAHPNTTEHHISWISLYFQPEGGKFTHDVGRFEFNAHGESAAGGQAQGQARGDRRPGPAVDPTLVPVAASADLSPARI